jgi:Calcium/calmodulin dependent protein kinase II association domain
MQPDPEILEFLLRHLQAIQDNDLDAYHATTHPDLTLYEWWITPQRIDGIPFHDFMMTENARRGTVFGTEVPEGQAGGATRTRFDLANLKIQRYGGTAVASYTLLNSSATPQGVRVVAHNESRVMVHLDGAWKVIHVHKSPAWPAPHVAPE